MQIHTSCSFQPFRFLKLRWRPWQSSFLQKQALTMSLQNNCSKQQQTLLGKLASVFEKDFTIGVLLHKKLLKAKIKASKSKKKLQCRDSHAEIFKSRGEWPSGLWRCSKNRKVPGLNPTRRSAGLRDPTLLRGFRWPSSRKCKTQWLTSVEWECPLNNGPKLAVGQSNSS